MAAAPAGALKAAAMAVDAVSAVDMEDAHAVTDVAAEIAGVPEDAAMAEVAVSAVDMEDSIAAMAVAVAHAGEHVEAAAMVEVAVPAGALKAAAMAVAAAHAGEHVEAAAMVEVAATAVDTEDAHAVTDVDADSAWAIVVTLSMPFTVTAPDHTVTVLLAMATATVLSSMVLATLSLAVDTISTVSKFVVSDTELVATVMALVKSEPTRSGDLCMISTCSLVNCASKINLLSQILFT